MKRAIAPPLLILLTILCFTLCNRFFMERNTTRWCDQLEKAVLFAQAEEWESVQTSLDEAFSDWSARQTYLHIVSTHDALKDADAMYHRAFAFTAAQEPSELQAELADLQAQLRFIAEIEAFNIRNIL